MHTHDLPGIYTSLALDLEADISWQAPLSVHEDSDTLEGLEGITEDEIDAAFGELEAQTSDITIDPALEMPRRDVEVTQVYDFTKLERVERRVVPMALEDVTVHRQQSAGAQAWDINSILSTKGISSV
jgi:hypothetical protein